MSAPHDQLASQPHPTNEDHPTQNNVHSGEDTNCQVTTNSTQPAIVRECDGLSENRNTLESASHANTTESPLQPAADAITTTDPITTTEPAQTNDDDEESHETSPSVQPDSKSQDEEQKNDVSDATAEDIKATTCSTQRVSGRKRKREKTRWGPIPRKKRWGSKQHAAKNTSALISNLLTMSNQKQTNTAIANAMFGSAWNEKQTKIFLLKNQLQEVSTRLIAPGAFAATQPEENRSPSPEPIYDQKGVRINTREYRLREKLQKQRIEIIQQLIALDPNYQPPADYKPPKLTHKIMMPVDDYPDYNFFGLIVGPRGNTQKEMQKETGCKIAVRGQGACLDKPGRLVHPDDNEPLHVHITAPNQESLDKAISMIDQLLEEVKTGGGEHKAKQLRELATINGTLRIEATRCRICGGPHPIYRCPEKTGEKWTPADVQCKICGELTHVTEDCKHYKRGGRSHHNSTMNNTMSSRGSIDAEYSAFMQELIGDAPMSSSRPIAAITAPPTAPKTQKRGVVVNSNNHAEKTESTAKSQGTAAGEKDANDSKRTEPVKNDNDYHNVPPPSQNGAQPPTEYVVKNEENNTNTIATEGADKGEENKTPSNGDTNHSAKMNGNNAAASNRNTGHKNGSAYRNGASMMPPNAMNNGMPMYPPPMALPMYPPNPYGMSMMNATMMNPMYGMRPGYPMMTMNPYAMPMAMPRPPFAANPYMQPPNPYMSANPYSNPAAKPAANIPPPPPPPPQPQ